MKNEKLTALMGIFTKHGAKINATVKNGKITVCVKKGNVSHLNVFDEDGDIDVQSVAKMIDYAKAHNIEVGLILTVKDFYENYAPRKGFLIRNVFNGASCRVEQEIADYLQELGYVFKVITESSERPSIVARMIDFSDFVPNANMCFDAIVFDKRCKSKGVFATIHTQEDGHWEALVYSEHGKMPITHSVIDEDDDFLKNHIFTPIANLQLLSKPTF